MKHVFGFLFAIGLAGAAVAQSLPSESEAEHQLAQARQYHVTALKSHNQAEIARSDEVLRHAYEVKYEVSQQAKNDSRSLAAGDTWQSQHALELAQDAHHDALLSGNKEEIDKTAKALRLAYENDYAVRHAKKPK